MCFIVLSRCPAQNAKVWYHVSSVWGQVGRDPYILPSPNPNPAIWMSHDTKEYLFLNNYKTDKIFENAVYE